MKSVDLELACDGDTSCPLVEGMDEIDEHMTCQCTMRDRAVDHE